jgi:lipopolysaccharide export system permease protein
MRILDRYVAKEFLRLLVLCMAAGLTIFMVVDLFENAGRLIDRQVPWSMALQFFLFKIPFIVSMGLPLAVLLASCLSLGILAKNVEITAMKASGISSPRITLPLIVLATVASLLLIFLNENITSHATERVNYIKDNYIEKEKSPSLTTAERTWFRDSRHSILSFELFDTSKNRMINVAIFLFDDALALIKTIDAKEASWDEKSNTWRLSEGYLRDFSEKGSPKITPIKEMMIKFEETPKSISRTQKTPEEMTFFQLYRYLKRMQASGIDVSRYLVDLYAKLSYPFACLMMVLVGIPFSLQTTHRSGNVISLVASVILGFSFFVIHSIFITLGHSGKLPAILAAWAPNLIFLGLGIYLFKRTQT